MSWQAARLLGLNRGALRYHCASMVFDAPSWETLTLPHDKSRTAVAIRPFEAELAAPTQCGSSSALEPAWEQKPSWCLTIDVTWPEAMEQHIHALNCRPSHTLVPDHMEKVHGLGGLFVQPAPFSRAVFGLPQTLEQSHARVQAALAFGTSSSRTRLWTRRQPGLEVRSQRHLGSGVDGCRGDDQAATAPAAGETLSLPMRLLGRAAAEGIFCCHPGSGDWSMRWFCAARDGWPAGADLLTASAPTLTEADGGPQALR